MVRRREVMGMDPNTDVLHHQSIVSPRSGRCAITLLETDHPVDDPRCLQIENARIPYPQAQGNAKPSLVAGNQTKGKGATGALVDAFNQPECFNRSLRSSCKRRSEPVASQHHFGRVSEKTVVWGLPGAIQCEPRWHTAERMPWGWWWETVGVGNRGKKTDARFPGFPRSVPTGHVVFTSRSSNEYKLRVPVNMRGRHETTHTTNDAPRVLTGAR